MPQPRPFINKVEVMKSLANPRKWFNVTESEAEADVYIYDVIGMDWWGDGVDPHAFIKEVDAIDAPKINLHINSPGGYINEGKAIYNFLKRLDKVVWAYIDGLAASTASWIPMAADKIICPANAEIMIHDPWGCICGGADDMRATAKTLDMEKEAIIGIYQARTGLDHDRLADLMSEEKWMLGAEALELGFVDEVEEDARLVACAFDLNVFNVLPKNAVHIRSANEKRKLENNLRDAGYSRQEAKRLSAGPDAGPANCDDSETAELERIGRMLDKINLNLEA